MRPQPALSRAQPRVRRRMTDRVQREFKRQQSEPAIFGTLCIVISKRAKFFRRIRSRFPQQLIQFGHALGDPMFEQREKQIFFVLEIRVQSAARVTRRRGDIFQARRFEAIAGKDAGCGINQLSARRSGSSSLRRARRALPSLRRQL